MEYISIMGICVIALLPQGILKKQAPEQALLLILAIVLAVMLHCIALVTPLLTLLEELFARAGIKSQHIAILLRTVVSALVTHLCADLCRDGGSQAVASVVETVGMIAALVIITPLVQAVTDLLLRCFK